MLFVVIRTIKNMCVFLPLLKCFLLLSPCGIKEGIKEENIMKTYRQKTNANHCNRFGLLSLPGVVFF